MKKLLCIVAALALVACGVSTANAAFVLGIDSPENPGSPLEVVVVDNAPAGTATQFTGVSTAADSDPTAGGIVWMGNVGVWSLTITTAESKPLLEGANGHSVGLHIIARSSGAGTIVIAATDTDFQALSTLTSLQSSVGGVAAAGATVDVQGEVDWQDGGVDGNLPRVSGNAEFSAYPSAAFGDPLLPDYEPEAVVVQSGLTGALSGVAATGTGVVPNAYSITNFIRLTHTVAGTSSVDHVLSHVPEPSSLAIFAGFALFGGVVGYRRRNRR